MVEVPKRDKMSNEFVSRTMIGKNELMKEVQEIRRKRLQEKNKKKGATVKASPAKSFTKKS